MIKKRKFFKTRKTYEILKDKLKERHIEIKKDLEEKHGETLDWLKEQGKSIDNLKKDAGHTLAATTATGILLLTAANPPKELPKPAHELVRTGGDVESAVVARRDIRTDLKLGLSNLVPGETRPLNEHEEGAILQKINEVTGIKVAADLEGYELNTNFGRTATEQHLRLYPGDNLNYHLSSVTERLMYGGSGMAQNRGAWGYFAGSRNSLTEEDILKERYYVAVQTFLTKNWQTKTSEAVKWFKHRKVIVINPETGQAVVAVIADSGPATWTGKQYGCSPEAIHYLGLAHGIRRGAILMFFVDDPENKVPLGPLSGV